MNKNIIWLASYPKSGNTWFRSFLTALQNEVEVDINDITEGKIFSSRNRFNWELDLDSSLLTYDEIKSLQGKTYIGLSNKNDQKQFYKIHDAFVKNGINEYIVPDLPTLCALYFVRNPLDVAVSFANHNASSTQETIELMADMEFHLGAEWGHQFQQPLLTWSQHYLSWTTLPSFPVLVIRYEDMLTDSFNTFKKAVNFIGLEYSDSEIQAAIDASSFEKLKKQEEENGFREKNPNSPRFFNNGTSGTWKGKLTEEQIAKVIADHGEVMRELGYL
jgi:Sulfotransferase domain